MLLVIGLAGCDSGAESIGAIRQATESFTATGAFGAANSVAANANDARPVKFEPPFPYRQDPFSLPGGNVGQPAAFSPTKVADVKVIGFADVDIPRVILRIGEQTKIMKLGDRNSGVEVLNIKPPKVELKMDNLIWTAAMFDDAPNR